MAGISAPLRDILTKLSTLQVVNNDMQTVPLFARVFNNQLKRLKEGKEQAIPFPAAFVEIVSPEQYVRIGDSLDTSDIVWRIHLTHWFTDATDGTFDQDLLIFDLRDNVISLLSNFQPTGCGWLVKTQEGQDYDHDDVYVYIIEFTCHFIDSKGSPYDSARTDFIDKQPPTDTEIDVTIVQSL